VTTQNILDGKVAAGDGAARSYAQGLISELPGPLTRASEISRLVAKAKRVIQSLKDVYRYDETSALFRTIVDTEGGSLVDLCTKQNDLRSTVAEGVDALREDVELAQVCIGVSDTDVCHEIIQEVTRKHGHRRHEALSEVDVVWATDTVMSYVVGCAFGRWNVSAQFERCREDAPFSELPATPLGMLDLVSDEAALDVPSSDPDRTVWGGILSDDPESVHDIVAQIRYVLEVLWKTSSDSIENEACAILGVKELRDYFRQPGKGGFWNDHVSRYSKSRRNAPIYWLLQSSRKSYALWLYYHRLDKDLLFKALVNHVEPKIRLENSRLETKRIAKEVERQEDFLSELRDFEDKLRRAANLHLEPDLNDGVVLNIAPLWELVPWKEAKSYWEDLLEGKYEWSSIGKQLRQKGLVK
jgi:hypothetical protein